mmetsp:Transcript_87669/g.195116  ORF Transcript_87669/g.195116 Transcript_87669/m.195116 type:complete len:118 (-) Transcript_87669:69-422(-)
MLEGAWSRNFASTEEDKSVLIMRKKMRHQARQRDDAMLGDFLIGFVEAHSAELDRQSLEDWQQLMQCDCETLLNLAADKVEVPKELDTPLLHRLKEFCTAGPARPGLTGDNPWSSSA